MKAKSLYIQKLAYDENTGNEIIGLFPSEANPAIVSSYTYDAKRMGGAPTLTATIYSSEPLQWKKEEFVEYNGDRFFASYTPNSTKDNSSRMWKSEITFTSRRELLDNTLFFDVVVDDVDTQNKDRYRSNQTKFTFGGTIYEFVARINSSMAYCGLYRPTDEHKGYYVVIDEGYGTDEVKEVSFEDQYLTDVLQLINTTFELDYYWDGNVCHVGKVQHDLTDTPIKYGSSDALISVSKENANYKIVDMITGYGSSDNLPYYYPNDDEFGEAIFDAKNIASEHVDVTLSDYLRYSKYNDNLVLFKSKKGKYEGNVDVSTLYVRDTYSPENLTQADNSQNPKVKCWFWVSIKINVKKGQIIDFSKISFNFELFDYIQKKENITNLSSATRTINIYTTYHDLYKNVCTDSNLGDACSVEFAEDGTFYIDIDAIFSYNCKVFTMDGKRTFYDSGAWKVSFSGDVVFSLDTNSEYSWKNGDNYIPLDNSGIYVNGIASAKYVEYDYNFGKNDEGIYGFDKIYTGTEDDAVQVSVTGRKWIAPSSVLMPSIYRNTKGAERFYYALNNTHKLPSGSGYYEFVNLYKKGNPHQGTVTFDDIKPTINGIVNAEGQLFGEIADVAFDKEDSDVKDSDGNNIHNYFYIKLHKFNGDFGFDLFAHALASEPAKINLIKSNGCPACSFVIYSQPSADNSKCYNCVSVDENGNLKPVRTDKNDYIFANASDAYEDKLNQDSTQKELWIAVQKDTSTLGIIMPNASAGFKPQKGDLFVITGIKPPKVLVTAAEKRLDDALIKHMSENNTDQFNYSVKFSRIFLQENPDFASKLNENAKLSIQIQGDSDSDGNLISHEVFVSNYSVKVDNDELAEVEIELVNSLEVTKSDTKQIIDAVKGETVKSLSSMVGGSNTNSFNASITDKMYLSKLKDDTANGTITFQKIQKFLQGLLIGGGSWTPDAEGRSHLITDYLEVRMKAIFEELVINKTSTIGGKEIISPAGGVVAHKVEEVTVTYNNVSQKAYRCYFLAEQEGDAVDNDFAVGDQVRSESFNVRKGTYHKVGNHFYWRLVIGRDEDPVELEGKKYHYIDLSDTDCATASDVPAKGDVLNQCGNRTDVERQNCLIFSAVDTYSPSISLYHGINSFSFANREYVEYGVNKQTNKAFFNVYGDMYVGDRPTKENGYEGSSYIRYDSSTKQLSVKGKISAKSTVDGKELSQYIKENTDDTVANEAKKAAEDAQKAAQTAQTNITNLGNTVTGNKKDFDNYVTNGYLEPSEIAAMAQDSKRLEDDFAAAQKSYNEVKEAEVLANTNELIDLKTAFDTLTTAKTELVTYLSDISARYNKADTNGKATIVSAVGTKFTNFQSAYASFYDKLGLANAYITRKIYGDLGVVIGDVATYQYLKKVLADSVETEINGGLILTSLIALRDPDTKRVESGINGVIDKTAKGNGIATWWGGYMNDGEVVGFDKKEDYSKQAATSLVRFDGSGYLANGAIWWGTDGRVHADPTSFIISEKNLGAYLTFFEPTWKAGSAGTSVADLVSLKPNAPFSKLGVSGDATFEGAISFHGIKITYDATNKAIKIDGNLYTTGGITAYGAGASTTGGGGLIASVISYARILEGSYTDADLTSIPNAYAIKALSSRIDNIATELGGLNLSWNNITGKPSTFTPSAHTHKWTEITDRITKVSQLTNDKGYLTAHQSLASYYTKAEIDAKGYTTNKGTVTSVALTLPTGLTCSTKTITTSGTFAISLASGYSIPTTAKQTAWDGAVSAKHTHSNKSVLDGITSTKVTCWDSAYDWYALITTDEETADGVINKWNEVVSFLANIAQTDTLSGIVDGINKSISDEVTRAKKAEGVNASGISTNKTSITTLQGYFTSGSAKKALQLTNTHKLWGNSFNGTADINGSIIVPDGKYISIGNIKMEYDATNKALKITNTTTNEVANLYTSGGVSAYGVGTSSSSGGGLNGSVKSYSNALKLTSESLSEIASAYSIKALDSRISSLEGGSATAISVSGSGNAVTSVTKNGTTISVVKGSTFLTSHQSLDGYVNAISVSGSGNAITSVSKSGKGITFTKGATFLTSHQSLANYYTKSSVDSLLSGKSATSHTHSVKINGVTKTIAATGGTAVDLGTYLTSHQSLADYAKKSEIPTKVSQLTNDTGYITSSGSCAYATSAGNADKVDGVHVTWAGELTSTNHLVAWEADGSALRDIKPANVTVGNSDKLDGIHANGLLTALSNSDKGISITVGGTTKSISNISVNYASSAGNADTVDGYHATTARVFDSVISFGSWSDVWSDGTNNHPWYGYDHRYPNTGAYSTTIVDYFGMTIKTAKTLRLDFSTLLLNGINIYDSNVASATKLQTPRTIWGQSFDGTGDVSGSLSGTGTITPGSAGIYDIGTNSLDYRYGYFQRIGAKTNTNLRLAANNSDNQIVLHTNGNVGIGTNSPAYKLHVVGDIYSTAKIRTILKDKAIILSDSDDPAWISAIAGEIVFNTGNAIRFGETDWNYNRWAGLKYTHSNKTIYLGIADGSAFTALSPQSDGTLRLAGIKTVTPDSGARIGNTGGDLYLGNNNNSAWVKVQDMCSQVNSSYWNITQYGSATFKSLTVNDVITCDSISVSKNAVIGGNLSVNGLINNKGMLPTNYEVNNKGTSCYVSADALCSGITAITDSIQVNQVTVQYSNDSGNSWTNYNISNDTKFKAYANVTGIDSLYLGGNVITGNTDAEKLAQIKKNELMFSFEISNSCYSQVYFACVDIGQGVGVTCTVEYLNSKGVIVNTYIKYMTGWNQFNYINLSNGNTAVGVGNDDRRYIRFRFKHDQNTTALQNASINKIRIFSFTKYSFPTDRFMGHTGHIYNFDYNMNTYFPNSILAKGGVTAYQSSDIRLKQDLRKLDYFGIIKAMGGTFGFAWKKDNTRSIGWIAQHVLCNPHLKDIVETDEDGYYKINYWSPKLIATAFGAIEQVGDEVSRLKARVVFLESEVLRLSGDKEDCNKKRLDNKNINSLN